jgi:hypothetical protein
MAGLSPQARKGDRAMKSKTDDHVRRPPPEAIGQIAVNGISRQFIRAQGCKINRIGAQLRNRREFLAILE